MADVGGSSLRFVLLLVVGAILVLLNVVDLANGEDTADTVLNAIGLGAGVFLVGYGGYELAAGRRR